MWVMCPIACRKIGPSLEQKLHHGDIAASGCPMQQRALDVKNPSPCVDVRGNVTTSGYNRVISCGRLPRASPTGR